jgi:hypothetical protein
MVRPAVLLGTLAIATPALAEDSVVLGHGVSNAFLGELPCPERSLCVDANYVWVLDADRTVAGPGVTGRVRAIATQHTDATAQFVKSVELFVLSPIQDQHCENPLALSTTSFHCPRGTRKVDTAFL